MALETLDSLYSAFDGLHMEGGWHRRAPALWPEPRHSFLPYRWRYAEVRPILEAAGRLVSSEQAERRNLTMRNPCANNMYATVCTMVAAYQLIKPGEVANAHRHTPNALRLILDGRGCYTVVDGVRVEMRPGDVLLTPSWTWHSHENVGNEVCCWIDVLDVPLVHLLENMFFERHPQKLEKDFVNAEDGPIVFRWEESRSRLAAEAEPVSNMASREIELGAPAMKTTALHIQEMHSGLRSGTLRSTANRLFCVIEGSGTTVIGGERFDWKRGDVIAVPSWRPYRHEVAEHAYLLQASDSPVLDALGFLRELRLT